MREAFAEAVAFSEGRAEAELDADKDKEALDKMSKVYKDPHNQIEDLLEHADKASAPAKEVEPEGQGMQSQPEEWAKDDDVDVDLIDMASGSSKEVATVSHIGMHESGQKEKSKRRRLGKKSAYEKEWICAIHG